MMVMGDQNGKSEQQLAPQNAPRPEGFFLNRQGLKLSVRCTLPSSPEKCWAAVLYLHGYCAHMNSKPKILLAQEFAEKGIAFLSYDQAAHGYSDGERVLLPSHVEYVADALQFLSMTVGGEQDSQDGELVIPKDILVKLREVPFFIAGESFGGSLAILTSLELQDRKESSPDYAEFQNYAGTILLAPAIVANPPPAPVVWLLENTVARWFPAACVPSFLESVHRPELNWKRQEDIDRVALDSQANGGLGWGRNTRFQSGLNMLRALEAVRARLRDVRFPYLALHDPEDGIVRFEGSRRLHEEAATEEEEEGEEEEEEEEGGDQHRKLPRSPRRELRPMPSQLHDLVVNLGPAELVRELQGWMAARGGRRRRRR